MTADGLSEIQVQGIDATPAGPTDSTRQAFRLPKVCCWKQRACRS